MYKIKYKVDGTVERYKALLVVLGNTQQEGVDFFTETFAPVIKMVTVWTLLSVTSAWNWPIHQMDIYNAFLNSNLLEEVYMRPPPRFKTNSPQLAGSLNLPHSFRNLVSNSLMRITLYLRTMLGIVFSMSLSMLWTYWSVEILRLPSLSLKLL